MAIASVLVFLLCADYGGLWGGLFVRVAMRAGLDTGYQCGVPLAGLEPARSTRAY